MLGDDWESRTAFDWIYNLSLIFFIFKFQCDQEVARKDYVVLLEFAFEAQGVFDEMLRCVY